MLDEFRRTLITWDKATSRIYSPVTANASDENGRKLVVQIVNSGQVEDLTGATLHLYWETRDKAHNGLDVFKAVDLKEGEFELSYTTGMLSNKGVLNTNLVLIDTVGRVVSERFKITVTEGIDNDAIQSENSFSSLTQALIDVGPRLNSLTAQLQQTEQELSSQLAQKANQAEVRLKSKGININDLDEPTRQTFLEAQGIDVNYVLGLKNVSAGNLDDNSVRVRSVDFIKDNALNLRILKDRGFAGVGALRLTSATGAVVYKLSIVPYQKIDIIALTPGDRFRVAVKNTTTDDLATEFNFDKILTTNDSLTKLPFVNDGVGKELFVYVNTGSSPIPNSSLNFEFEPTIIEFTKPTYVDGLTRLIEPRDVDFIKGAELFRGEYSNLWMSSLDGLITQTGTNTRSVLVEIKNGVEYHIVTKEPHDRFVVGVTNSLADGGVGKVLYSTATTSGKVEYSFVNTEGHKYLVVGLSATMQEPRISILDYKGLNIAGREIDLTNIPAQQFGLKVSAIADTTKNSLTQNKVDYPTLFAVKTSNARTKALGFNTHPTPMGWLYYHDKAPYKLLYADGKPDNMRELCTWDETVAYNGAKTPKNYSPYITKDGDIIFVFRGEQQAMSANARQNPILYPAGDYDNPVVIDFGDRIKPTSWLQNCGADYIYNQDCFIFAEYTRPVHDKCYVWKVTKPFSNPDNWRIVKEFDVSGSMVDGFKHCHTINFDPYSEAIYLATGDDNSVAAIYESRDYGETWTMVLGTSEKLCRLLNFIFTEDKIYWASDSGKINYHFLFEVSRDVNGFPDFSTVTELWEFPYKPKVQATYASVLINEPHGILFLDRFDNPTTEDMNMYFWSFETESAHIIHSFSPLDGQELKIGFRNEAVNWYQADNDSRIVCGFGFFPNEMDVLGNRLGNNADRVSNLALEVIRI